MFSAALSQAKCPAWASASLARSLPPSSTPGTPGWPHCPPTTPCLPSSGERASGADCVCTFTLALSSTLDCEHLRGGEWGWLSSPPQRPKAELVLDRGGRPRHPHYSSWQPICSKEIPGPQDEKTSWNGPSVTLWVTGSVLGHVLPCAFDPTHQYTEEPRERPYLIVS